MLDAFRPAMGMDAPINQRALFESFDMAQDKLRELVRSPKASVRPICMRPDWASLVLGPFAETKGPRPPERNPASQEISGSSLLQNRVTHILYANRFICPGPQTPILQKPR